MVLQLTAKQFGGIENAETAARALKRQLDQDRSWADVKKMKADHVAMGIARPE